MLYFRSVITLSLALVHSQRTGSCSHISSFVLVGTFLCDILSIRMISDPSDAQVASESNYRWTLLRTAAKNILCFMNCLMPCSLGRDVSFPKQEKKILLRTKERNYWASFCHWQRIKIISAWTWVTSSGHSLFCRVSVHSAIQTTVEYSDFFLSMISKRIECIYLFF